MSDRRLHSLDALRGFDMLFISGLASLILAVCALFPDGADCAFAQQFRHPDWEGFTFYDTIFPLFLFIAGVSWPFSYSKQKESGASRRSIYLKIFRRALTLFLLGMLYNGVLKDFGHIRLYSVLGRIGLAWMGAALLYVNFRKPVLALISAAILIGYWLLCMIPAPDAGAMADPLSEAGCLAGWVDRSLYPQLLQHRGVYDQQGLLPTLPAVVTALLGMFTGDFIRREDLSGGKKTLRMLAAAAVCIGLGLLWAHWFPINKKLWTSSFVLVVAAYSLAVFALFYWVIDVRGHQKWAFPFRVIGMNSILIYLLPPVLGFRNIVNYFFGGLVGCFSQPVGQVVFWVAYIALAWLLLYYLYKKKIFLKV